MDHSSTLDHIVALSEAEQALLAKGDLLNSAERAEFRAIRDALAKLWPMRRAELVFQVSGPPRLIGGGTDRDQQRLVARGIAPLPRAGGD